MVDAPSGLRDTETFDAIVFPIRTMTIRDYIQDDYPRTAIALAEDLTARYPENPELVQLTGEAWASGASAEALANIGPQTTGGQWWRLLTSAFVPPGVFALIVSLVGFVQPV